MFFTGQQRPSTGKEARRQRSAKITADLENDAPVFDDDFYRYSFVYLTDRLEGKEAWYPTQREVLPCWLSQFSFAKMRQLTEQTFFPTFPKEFSHFLQT